MTLAYDPKRTTPKALARVVERAGFRVEVVRPTAPRPAIRPPRTAPLPEDAPAFFRRALERARKERRPVVIAFGATWCGPCRRLEKETLRDPAVRELLEKIELVHVDLDEHPELAHAYRVHSVPDVIFVDRSGKVVDRLRAFEPATGFRSRLQLLLEPPREKARRKPPREHR